MVKPTELEFLAGLTFLFVLALALLLRAAGEPGLSTWVSLVGGFVVTFVEVLSLYRRLYSNSE